MTESPQGVDPKAEAVPIESDAVSGRLVFHSICSAACAIVPVPFLDDHLVKLTRRRMARELAHHRGFHLTKDEIVVLSGTESKKLGWGCFVGLAVALSFKIVIKIIRRVFRTILFWLLIKDAADAASRTFHEGYLLAGALEREPRAARALREPIDNVLHRVNTKALNHVFKGVLSGSRALLVTLAKTLSRLTGLAAEQDEGEERLEQRLEDSIPLSLVEKIAARLRLQGAYLRQLDELLEEELFKTKAQASPLSESDEQANEVTDASVE